MENIPRPQWRILQRVYYGQKGPWIILLICGGDKSTQSRDIEKARRLWAAYRRLR